MTLPINVKVIIVELQAAHHKLSRSFQMVLRKKLQINKWNTFMIKTVLVPCTICWKVLIITQAKQNTSLTPRDLVERQKLIRPVQNILVIPMKFYNCYHPIIYTAEKEHHCETFATERKVANRFNNCGARLKLCLLLCNGLK